MVLLSFSYYYTFCFISSIINFNIAGLSALIFLPQYYIIKVKFSKLFASIFSSKNVMNSLTKSIEIDSNK